LQTRKGEVISITTRKDLAIAIITTFCLTVTLFTIIPSRSQTSGQQYDPWIDLNDDGQINILDLYMVARAYGTSGAAINKTALILELQSQVQDLQAKVKALEMNSTAILPDLYESVKDSVVLIRGVTNNGTVQGSGFVYNFTSSMVIITNNHVVSGTTSVSVSFSDGNAYPATVNGTDPYSDLAILSVTGAPKTEYKPLQIASSSTLRVGNLVLAIGNPYGLIGSMTTGVVSALGRTITEDQYTGGYAIANIIQTSVPINPGNSGGPLLNSDGKVVGITAAIVADSQGLAFAIPSNAILREISSLIETGAYTGHPYLGVTGADMDYETAQTMHANVTYGWLIGGTVPGGPAANAGVQVNDIIIGMNGTRIRSIDDMSSYLEENTLPGQTIILRVVRSNQTREIPLILGTRPPPPG
jgi:S1-C subfamily serine protease